MQNNLFPYICFLHLLSMFGLAEEQVVSKINVMIFVFIFLSKFRLLFSLITPDY